MDLQTSGGKPVTSENAYPPTTSARIPHRQPTTTNYSRTPAASNSRSRRRATTSSPTPQTRAIMVEMGYQLNSPSAEWSRSPPTAWPWPCPGTAITTTTGGIQPWAGRPTLTMLPTACTDNDSQAASLTRAARAAAEAVAASQEVRVGELPPDGSRVALVE